MPSQSYQDGYAKRYFMKKENKELRDALTVAQARIKELEQELKELKEGWILIGEPFRKTKQ